MSESSERLIRKYTAAARREFGPRSAAGNVKVVKQMFRRLSAAGRGRFRAHAETLISGKQSVSSDPPPRSSGA